MHPGTVGLSFCKNVTHIILITDCLPNFAFFTGKSPGVNQRLISQENVSSLNISCKVQSYILRNMNKFFALSFLLVKYICIVLLYPAAPKRKAPPKGHPESSYKLQIVLQIQFIQVTSVCCSRVAWVIILLVIHDGISR